MPAITAAFGVGASLGSAEKVKGNARIVLLVGFAAFVFLLAGTIDEAWVRSSFDVEYSSGGGETSTGETVTKFGLTTSSATQPTFLTEIVSEFILTVSYPSGIAAQLVNAQNEATGGPTASSGDTPATGLLPLAMALIVISMICIATRYLAGSECCSPTCGTVMHWAAGVCAVLGGVLALVGVITFASAGIEKALCYLPEGTEEPPNYSCGYGGAFAVAIVGAVFALVQGVLFFVLIKLGDVTAVQQDGEVKSSNPAGMV